MIGKIEEEHRQEKREEAHREEHREWEESEQLRYELKKAKD